MTFRRDIRGEEEIKAGLSMLADSVAGRLRADHKKCTVVQVGVKDPNFRTVQKQRKLDRATDLQKEITEVAFQLFCSCWSLDAPVRLLSVTGSGLIGADEDYVQMGLFDADRPEGERQEKIESTIDSIRGRFGKDAIRFGHYQNDETGVR